MSVGGISNQRFLHLGPTAVGREARNQCSCLAHSLLVTLCNRPYVRAKTQLHMQGYTYAGYPYGTVSPYAGTWAPC